MAFATKRRAALLKLIGAAVVFASAVSQHFQYDRARRESDRLTDAISAQALIDKGALIHQTSMYVLYGDVAVPQRDELRASHARFVALKLYQGVVPFITTVSGVSQETKAKDLASLRHAVGSVRDVVTLSDFMRLHGVVSEKYEPALTAQLDRLKQQQAASEWAYMGLYALGGLLLFLAGWIDWRLAEPTLSATPAGKPKPRRSKR